MPTIVDDSEDFTIAVEPAVTCDGNSPNHRTGCDLMLYWDKDGDGVISVAELEAAVLANLLGSTEEPVSDAEVAFLANYPNGPPYNINDVCAGCLSVPGKGEITAIDYPVTAVEGTTPTIEITVENVGGEPATLAAWLYEGITAIGTPTGAGVIQPGSDLTQIYTPTMPSHAWNLTAKAFRYV